MDVQSVLQSQFQDGTDLFSKALDQMPPDFQEEYHLTHRMSTLVQTNIMSFVDSQCEKEVGQLIRDYDKLRTKENRLLAKAMFLLGASMAEQTG